MSDLKPNPELILCEGTSAAAPVREAYPVRTAELGGGLSVRRALPHRSRRLVGPWCFLDHFGPLSFKAGKPMDVPPHPHIGLQTVTWIIEGEVLHKDSLGNEQLIRRGALNLMTAGNGIAHSEETPPRHSHHLHGVQLWTALPADRRKSAAAFDHYPALPAAGFGACRAVLLMGSLGAQHSPAVAYSPIVGAELSAERDGSAEVPLEPAFEYALLLLEGSAALEGEALAPDRLYYLGAGRARLTLALRRGLRLMLIGGAPFGESILMWWNFVARAPEEIAEARSDWEARRRFGEVSAYAGERLAAPAFVGRLKPGG
ncbi:MAG: pirin family protein [Alphaproteobacteria bacterium]